MPDACSFEGCERKHSCKGLCDGHYQQRRAGKTLSPLHRKAKDFTDLEWKLREYSEPADDGCRVWTMFRDKNGYGFVSHEGRRIGAHRASLEQKVGPLPEGWVANHICKNPPCINPDHLEGVPKSWDAQYTEDRSPHRGVVHDKRDGKYIARAQKDLVRYTFGYFNTIEEAAEAARLGRERIGFHDPKLEEENAVGTPEPTDAEELPAQLS